MFILEAHAAAAGEPSLQHEAKKNVPAVPPRAGRRSLQMKQESYHIAGGDTRKIMSRASTKNMIEMCRALEAAEPSDQYNLVVTELVNTERQFVSDMLAVSMVCQPLLPLFTVSANVLLQILDATLYVSVLHALMVVTA